MLVRSMSKAILSDSFNYVLQSSLLLWSYFALIKTFGMIFSMPDNILGLQTSILSFTCIFFSSTKTMSTKVLQKKSPRQSSSYYILLLPPLITKLLGKELCPSWIPPERGTVQLVFLTVKAIFKWVNSLSTYPTHYILPSRGARVISHSDYIEI